jgi:hypothetical protein
MERGGFQSVGQVVTGQLPRSFTHSLLDEYTGTSQQEGFSPHMSPCYFICRSWRRALLESKPELLMTCPFREFQP